MKKENTIKEYQACYYKDEDAFMNGDMKKFRSFDTSKECNDYIRELIKTNKQGFIQLLLKCMVHLTYNTI